MRVVATGLADLVVVHGTSITDARGRFERLFCSEEWASLRPDLRFAQVNLSTTSQRGTIRGMHFQRPPAAEAKLIRCVRGKVFDVAVDLRAGSSTFLKWHGTVLSEGEATEVFIPEGFAHGFQALTDDVQLLYFHTTAWTPSCEGGLRHDDPKLAIDWPLPPVSVSARDRDHDLIGENFTGLQA